MHAERVNPPGLYNSTQYGFSHAVRQHGGDTLHLAGQVAWDGRGDLVGRGDLQAQTRQALQNLSDVLTACGASVADLVRLRTYVVKNSPEKLGTVLAEIGRFYGNVAPAANTLVGVEALALPEFLIEIEATAVVARP